MIDELGGPKTYNHYPNGWAMAFNTPFKMWKRYEFNGGSCDPCIISWPKGIKARGEIRHQYHHAIDITPDDPRLPRRRAAGDDQGPRAGELRRHQHALQLRRGVDPDLRARRSSTRCSARGRSGTRAGRPSPPIRRSPAGATSTTTRGSSTTSRSTARSCTTSRASTRTRCASWSTCGSPRPARNGAFPLDDRSPIEIINTPRPQLTSPRDRYRYFPDVAEVPEAQAVNIRNRDYIIGMWVDIPAPAPSGVLFAQGSQFGGHTLYVKDNRLHYVYNFVGMLEQTIVATEELPIGDNLILSAAFEKDGEDPPGVCTGILSLYHGEQKVGEAKIKTQPGDLRPDRHRTHRRTKPPRDHRRLPGRAALDASPAARSSSSPSTSAASPTSTSSARPPR